MGMNKGQLFSLDLVLALALLVLAAGIVFQQTELFVYQQKDLGLLHELEVVGAGASQELVSSPAIVCELVSGGNTIDYLNNCIPLTPNDKEASCAPITASALGIPLGYDFRVSFSSGGSEILSCGPSVSETGSVYSVDRKVVSPQTKLVYKSEFEECANPFGSDRQSCVFGNPSPSAIKTVTLSVWRDA